MKMGGRRCCKPNGDLEVSCDKVLSYLHVTSIFRNQAGARAVSASHLDSHHQTEYQLLKMAPAQPELKKVCVIVDSSAWMTFVAVHTTPLHPEIVSQLH